jgi:Cathepsin propeptide inhibitor domain (I29)
MRLQVMLGFGAVLAAFVAASASKPPLTVGQKTASILLDERDYSFEKFLTDFALSYDDKVEYQAREAIFYENLSSIVQHNRQQMHQKGGGYWLGINPFADRRASELHRGYDKYQSSRLFQSSTHRRLVEEQDMLEKLKIQIEPVEDLPKSVDWRAKGVTTPVKSQGSSLRSARFAFILIAQRLTFRHYRTMISVGNFRHVRKLLGLCVRGSAGVTRCHYDRYTV